MIHFDVIQNYLNILGLVLLHSLWQGTLIAFLLFVLLRVAKRSSANIRYALAIGSLGLALAAPIVTFGYLIPSSKPVNPVDEAALMQRRSILNAAVTTRENSAAAVLPDSNRVDNSRSSAVNNILRSDLLLLGISLVWLAGEILLGIRFARGLICARRLRRRGTPLDAAWRDNLARLSRSLQIGRTVRFLESTMVEVPTVVGWLRPVVLIPTSTILGLSPAQLEAVIAHELAHIRRNDYLVNLLQSVAELLLFYHPAARWISCQVRNERELVCDDVAVSSCGDPLLYARALTRLERLRSCDDQFVLSASGGDLKMRVLRLIDNEQKLQAGIGPLFAVGIAAAVLLAACAPSVLSRQLAKAPADAAPAPVAKTTKSVDVQHLNPAIADLVANDDITNEDPEVRAAVLSALGERAGAVIVMDAKSGRLYSVVNQEWALKRDWVPASLMKVVSSMVALDHGLLDPTEALSLDGTAERMKFREAFAESNNSYFRMVAEKAGADQILEYAGNLGLGQRTGVNYSSEAAGRLPTSAEVRVPGRMGAYGEGVRVTPLQLASMFAAIGNGGSLLTPQAVLSDAVQPKVRRTIAIPSTTLATIQAAMIETVERGTGTGAHVDGFSIGGKTGTTDAKDNSTGLFASYSPANNPRIVVMVVTQGRKENGLAASTIAGAIYKAIGRRFQLDH